MIYLLLKNIRRTILIISTMLLIACSTPPLSMQLQPQLAANPSARPLTNKADWEIGSQDQRIAQYLIEITEGEGAATLVNESQSSRLMIENTLQQQWNKHGIRFTAESTDKINIQLIKLLTKVEQNTLSHKINSTIIIKVELSTKSKVFSKTFRSRFAKEGPFSAEIKETGKQLNIQLSQLLTEIVQDPQLNAKLQQL